MQWFQPPQLRIGDGIEEDSRHATWLELFFDLVFVVAVAQVAHYLHEHISLSGFLGYTLLFLPVWWAWVGATLYSNRFDVDDSGHRLLTGVQMLGIGVMAVNVHHALSSSSIGFALGYIAIRVILILQYLRAARHVPAARQLSTRYAIGFTLAISFWIASLFVPLPLRLWLWAIGMVVDFAVPISALTFASKLVPNLEHMPERFGLFVIIVLGEAIIAVVNGISQQEWQPLSVLMAVLGFAIAFSFWWIYFENVSGSALRQIAAGRRFSIMMVWLYGHLPLVIGLAAAGIAVEKIILSAPTEALADPKRWLVCGSVSLCLLSLALLHQAGVIYRCRVRARFRLGGAIALITIALLGSSLSAIAVISLVSAIMVFQVAQDIYQGRTAPAPAAEA